MPFYTPPAPSPIQNTPAPQTPLPTIEDISAYLRNGGWESFWNNRNEEEGNDPTAFEIEEIVQQFAPRLLNYITSGQLGTKNPNYKNRYGNIFQEYGDYFTNEKSGWLAAQPKPPVQPPMVYNQYPNARGGYASPWSGYDPFGKTMLEATPRSAMSPWLESQGMDMGSSGYNFGQGMYDDLQNDYFATSAAPGNQGLGWLDYLDNLGAHGKGPKDIWSGFSPTQRGERSAGKASWVGF